ncbi:MAG: hypothetical protein KDK89_12820 [Alphaproteobacteria bacterium]|nr:hypothetical protein [Alphaproteobacteria bacterium]
MPRLQPAGNAALDELLIAPSSDLQLAIVDEIEARVPVGEGEREALAAILARW